MSTFKRAYFQEAAVRHIVGRLRDTSGSRRMLLADEVGLGKTVVARGVIEALLQSRRKPLTVIYLCSNAEIAEQNREKLDPNSRRPFGRVTELAVEHPDDKASLRLYSFTPGTSLRDGTGLAWERRLLMYLLLRTYRFKIWRKHWREFFRCGVREEHWYPATSRRALRREFERKIPIGLQSELAAAWREQTLDGSPIITTTESFVSAFNANSDDDRRMRNRLVARLRGVMQRVVLRHLHADLVILDEVQRFREVLDEAENPEHIAAELFAARTPVLILSATPYRALTLGHEVADGASSHHEDFFRTLEFLFDRDAEMPRRIRTALEALGKRLRDPALLTELDPALLDLKRSLEDDLRRVICRTERNWYVLDRRKGVEDLCDQSGVLPGREELEEFFRLHGALARWHATGQITEFWKSAPSLLTFLDAKYALLRKLRDERIKVPRSLLTPASDVAPLGRRNHRISRVVGTALGDDEAPPRLWTAPTYTYYQDELFGATAPRKLLVFSGWRFVPKTVAIITSRVAIDRVGGEPPDPTQPLRFTERKSFHTFDVCFPSPLLARIGAEAYEATLQAGGTAGARDLLNAAETRVRASLARHGVEIIPTGGDSIWRVVLRLERAEGHEQRIKDALDAWAARETEEGASEHVARHRDWAGEWLSQPISGTRLSTSRLQRLALIAAFSPATCLLNALESVYPRQDVSAATGDIASLCLGSLRRYFNRPYVQQVVRAHRSRLPWRQMAAEDERGYTERVLVYSADAHLQAVLDEYVYLIRHATQADEVTKAIERLQSVWTLASGTPRTNTASGRGNLVSIKADDQAHPTHFALAFGEEAWRGEGPDVEGDKLRKSAVREAFNSPFWPFVLATTSVGQEGLDFHLYCRDVLHWNLPSNPVDLEQREGRVNRRDCLAVRQSISRDWRLEDPATWGGAGERERNPWPVVFKSILLHDDHQKYKHGLFPHWIYECRDPRETVRICRHVPCFSTSRDASKYERLKFGLALYRLVFGQVNQEDLLEDLQRQIHEIGPEEHDRVLRRLASYMLNLSPIGHEEALRHAKEEADSLLAEAETHQGLEKLLADVERIRVDRAAELAEVETALRGLIRFVRDGSATGERRSRSLRRAVAALAYLRNPYDRIFDLHVEGGFSDDVAVISSAWASLRSAGRTQERTG